MIYIMIRKYIFPYFFHFIYTKSDSITLSSVTICCSYQMQHLEYSPYQ